MTAPRRTFPLDRWTVLVLIAASLLTAGFALLDSQTTWSLLVLYLIPVCAVAWLTRGYWWIVMILFSAAAWYYAQWVLPDKPNATTLERFWDAGIRAVVFGSSGFLVARLRFLSRHPSTLGSAHDSTGMLSLSGLNDQLKRIEVRERFAKGPVAVYLVDVERKVTAYRGLGAEHTALVSAVVSKTILSNARQLDLCARISPNHYLILMPETTQADAEQMARVINEEFPALRRTLDDSFSTTTYLCTATAPAPSPIRLRQFAESRLVQCKILAPGKHHAEPYPSHNENPWRDTAPA